MKQLSSHTLMVLRRLALLAALIFAPSGIHAYELQYAKFGDVVRWQGSCFHYSVHQTGVPGHEFGALQDAVRDSFAAWEDVDCSYFFFEETTSASCRDVGFCQYGGNMNLLIWEDSNWAVDKYHVDNAMALTTLSYDDANGRILDADIEFNAEFFDFGLNGETHLTDIQNTATHEIGHMLGLDHSFVPGSTMNLSAQPGDIDKRELAQDDIDGLCELYPTTEDPNTCEAPYNGLDLNCSSETCNEQENDNESGPLCAASSGIGSGSKNGLLASLLTFLFVN